MPKMNFHDRLKNIGRNDPCPCDSGKKYKKCHLPKDQDAEHKEFLLQQEELEAQQKTKKKKKDEPDKEKDDNRTDHSIFKHGSKLKSVNVDKMSNLHRKTTNK